MIAFLLIAPSSPSWIMYLILAKLRFCEDYWIRALIKGWELSSAVPDNWYNNIVTGRRFHSSLSFERLQKTLYEVKKFWQILASALQISAGRVFELPSACWPLDNWHDWEAGDLRAPEAWGSLQKITFRTQDQGGGAQAHGPRQSTQMSLWPDTVLFLKKFIRDCSILRESLISPRQWGGAGSWCCFLLTCLMLEEGPGKRCLSSWIIRWLY